MTRLNLQSARHVDLLAVILAVADPTCLAWRGQKNYFRPTTQYIVGAFVRLGALEPLHPNADEWLLQALHKHGGEDWDAVVRDPAFDALRRGRNVPTLKAALARLVGADSTWRSPNSSGAAAGGSGESGRVGPVLAVREVAPVPQGRRRFITAGRLDLRRLECLMYKPQCSFEEDEACPAILVQRILVSSW